MVDVAAENNSVTIFPIPIELFGAILKPGEPSSDEATARARLFDNTEKSTK